MTKTTTSYRIRGKTHPCEETTQPEDGTPELRGESLHETAEALGKAMIAEMPPAQISRMNRMELIRVIQGSALRLLRPEIQSRLEYYDRQTLERLAYLARRCRNQDY
jgi:hypothetical protein